MSQGKKENSKLALLSEKSLCRIPGHAPYTQHGGSLYNKTDKETGLHYIFFFKGSERHVKPKDLPPSYRQLLFPLLWIEVIVWKMSGARDWRLQSV